VGTGMIVSLSFSREIADRAAVERAVRVSAADGVGGPSRKIEAKEATTAKLGPLRPTAQNPRTAHPAWTTSASTEMTPTGTSCPSPGPPDFKHGDAGYRAAVADLRRRWSERGWKVTTQPVTDLVTDKATGLQQIHTTDDHGVALSLSPGRHTGEGLVVADGGCVRHDGYWDAYAWSRSDGPDRSGDAYVAVFSPN
ncbi:Ig-like domain-containing protein, partial [Streptomyces sp. NPDC001709]